MDNELRAANVQMAVVCDLLEEATGATDPVSCIPAMQLLRQAVALRDGLSQLVQAREERDLCSQKRQVCGV
jgi:hypothetical protein